MKKYFDKHNREIKIGDIVKWKKSKFPMIVVPYDEEHLRAKNLDSNTGRSFEVFPSDEFEIIKA